jgi:lysophospholipase L1-like esterase
MRMARWCYLVVLHAILLVLIWKTDFRDRVAQRLGLEAIPEMGENWSKRVAFQVGRIDGQVPPGAVLFFGDSIIGGLLPHFLRQPYVNYGIGFDTTAGVLTRLPEYRSPATASAVVVLVGINDHRYRDADGVTDHYMRILRQLAQVPRVVAVSVTPIDERASHRPTKATNNWIVDVNRRLAQACAAQANCRFADAWPGLTAGRGALPAALHEGDGLHLNPKGYAILATAIAPALAP